MSNEKRIASIYKKIEELNGHKNNKGLFECGINEMYDFARSIYNLALEDAEIGIPGFMMGSKERGYILPQISQEDQSWNRAIQGSLDGINNLKLTPTSTN